MREKTGIRWGNRCALDIGVRIFRDSVLLGDGCITNASTSGAYLETSVPLPLNSNILLQPTRIGVRAVAAGIIHACVLRADGYGVGLEWRDMACPEVAAILNQETQESQPGSRTRSA